MSRQMLTSSCSWSSVTLAELLSWTKSVKRWHKLLNSWHDHRAGPIALASLRSVLPGPGCTCGFAVSRTTRLKTASVYRESGALILPLVSSPPWAHRIEARHRVSHGSQYSIAHKHKKFFSSYSNATKSQNSIPLHTNHRLLLFHISLRQNMTISNETSLIAPNRKKRGKRKTTWLQKLKGSDILDALQQDWIARLCGGKKQNTREAERKRIIPVTDYHTV
jgi:hypothetical protein